MWDDVMSLQACQIVPLDTNIGLSLGFVRRRRVLSYDRLDGLLSFCFDVSDTELGYQSYSSWISGQTTDYNHPEEALQPSKRLVLSWRVLYRFLN